MWLFSSVDNKVIEESEVGEASEDEESKDKYTFLKHCIYENDYVSLYATDSRDFINDIHNTNFNRNVDEAHVKNLINEFKKSKHSVGTFKIVNDGNQPLLIDGQHRVMAIHELMKEDCKFNMKLILEVYNTQTKEENREWFRRANNVRNLDACDTPNEVVEKVIDELNKKFEDMIIPPKITDGRIYRPKVNATHLTLALKNLVDTKNYVSDELYIKMINMNNQMGLKTKNELKATDNMWEKAKTSGFYLGLSMNLKWVAEL